MKILVVNPNSTASMTEKIAQSARRFTGQGVEIIACTAVRSPASIEGHYDEAMSMGPLLKEVIDAEKEGIDGVVVACFDDPGIGACREVGRGPVMGICEAGMKAATILSALVLA